MATQILRRFTHKINVNAIELRDHESSKAGEKDTKIKNPEITGYNQNRGLRKPEVRIGSTLLDPKDIYTLSLWQQDLLPRVSITFFDNAGIFGAGGYPIANILASVWIQSPVEPLSSQASDFLINNISSMTVPGSPETIYTVTGELHIPKIHGTVSKAFSNKTSLDALQEVAKDLNLGFADNITESPNDKMTWLIPNYNYRDAISHFSSMAYTRDTAFFDCFIDRYYHLNFINVEEMLSQTGKPEQGIMNLRPDHINTDKVDPEKKGETPTETTVDITLTNRANARNTEFFIKEWSLLSNHGEILKDNSLRKYANWYDHGANTNHEESDSVNFISHFAEPLESAASNDGSRSHRAELTEFANADSVIKKWVGINYGNAHANYKFAQLINQHNKAETEKNLLKVKTEGFNINIVRGSRIGVEIYLARNESIQATSLRTDPNPNPNLINEKSKELMDSKNSPLSAEMDKTLSAFYYVKSIKHTYTNGLFETELLLSRRQWILPTSKNEILT